MNQSPVPDRRSVYLQQRRTQDQLARGLRRTLDRDDVHAPAPSTIPLQSLSLLNSDFCSLVQEKLAMRIEIELPEAQACPQRRLHQPSVPDNGRPIADQDERSSRGDSCTHSNYATPGLQKPISHHTPGRFLPDALGQ